MTLVKEYGAGSMKRFQSDSSSESLQRSLTIYRQLFALMQKAASEQEVIRQVVDLLFLQFPDGRVSYSSL